MFGTIIFGKATTGKSRFATHLIRHEKAFHINGSAFRKLSKFRVDRDLDKVLSFLPLDTTVIYVDDCPVFKLDVVLNRLLDPEIKAEERGKDAQIISPRVIVTCDSEYDPELFGASHRARFNFITCLESKKHEVAMLWHHPVQSDAFYLGAPNY